jgi:hypothetical protein
MEESGEQCINLLRNQLVVGGGGCREGMGLLEDQAMPSLRDEAHGGVLCIVCSRSAPLGQVEWSGPSIMYKITPCWITFVQPARRAAVLASSLAFFTLIALKFKCF